MSISVYFVDLRNGTSEYTKVVVPWNDGMKAIDVLNEALAPEVVQSIVADLTRNHPYLMVSWNSGQTRDHSDIGGVGSLDWLIKTDLTLTIIYEDENTCEHQIDESAEWLLQNYR